jgi:hypothetical protein
VKKENGTRDAMRNESRTHPEMTKEPKEYRFFV